MVKEQVQVIGYSAAEPAAVWAVAGDFCSPWHPAIDRLAAERDSRGALIRAFTVKGEDTLYREQLIYRSDSDRTLVYSHLEGITGVDSYGARLSVSAGENGGSVIEWSARLAATPDRAAAIAGGTKAIFEQGLAALAERVEQMSAPAIKPAFIASPLALETRALASVVKNPSPTPPHRGEGLNQPHHQRPDLGGTVPRVFSPLVGEMAGRPEGAFVEDNGVNLETVILDGSPRLAVTVTPPKPGPLVLFLHGIGGGRSNWLPQLQAIAPKMRAAALDLRGYGDSALGPAQSIVEDYCDDILRVADALQAERLVLCGLSYGSWIATSFAMRHPERLSGLVLSGGCTGMSEASAEERDAFRQAREVPLDAGLTPADFAPAVVNVLASLNADETVRRALLASMASIPAATYRNALVCFTHPPERFDLSRLTMPVLMMTGEHDRLAPPAEIRGVAERIAGLAPHASVRFEVIAGAGHVCNVERPAAYNTILTDFLAEIPR